MGRMERKALFEPLHLGGIRLKNRLVMAPMGTNYASPTGEVTERLLDYYEERARGGILALCCGAWRGRAPGL